MFSVTAYHIPHKILERGCDKELGFMFRPDLSIICAADVPKLIPQV